MMGGPLLLFIFCVCSYYLSHFVMQCYSNKAAYGVRGENFSLLLKYLQEYRLCII
jgi:hypothetical protein